ncbi:hypothetical protein Q31b_43410 [Novipirellula aureliae]|uniref:Uncharacterized protein n=1 Tax=Novipirellula aureliae TaxID=2527966 RepID=A0A5C6DJJ9_9BACT|nr:hypothetical protein [Novipirellula aureliae]TWU37553.1 hypothetical protein Q31b_43410 [Novipirellula aureliae]
MFLQRYLDVLAAILLFLLLGTTYRDIADGQDDSLLVMASRFIVFPSLAYGLVRRNVWVVRLVYIFSIFTISVFFAGKLVLGFSMSTTQAARTIAYLMPFACTVFISRDKLLPKRRPFVAVGKSSNPENPYVPPSGDSRKR